MHPSPLHMYPELEKNSSFVSHVLARAPHQMEVVKTRMQLQGELVLRGGSGSGDVGKRQPQQAYQAPYRNAPHAFYKICRDEGFRGIQAGLLPGLMYQVHVCPLLCVAVLGVCRPDRFVTAAACGRRCWFSLSLSLSLSLFRPRSRSRSPSLVWMSDPSLPPVYCLAFIVGAVLLSPPKPFNALLF